MPNKESVLYRKGLCLMSMNKHSQAIKYFDKTIKKDYHYAEAHFNKANCLFVIGEYRKAVNHFMSAVLHGEFATNLDLLMIKGFCHYHLL
jgi:tetratricopeptide (TPR) repeat protein